MSFYRFPAMAKLNEWSNEQQANYVLSEAEEAKSAQSFMDYGEGSGESDRMDYGMELMDVIHSAETALRMEFTNQEIAQLQDSVIEKNRARGYYDSTVRQ